MNTYDVGDIAKITGVFTADGAPLDPTAVTLLVRLPDGTKTTYTYGEDVEVVKASTGSYYLRLTITQPGRHAYRWASTGSGVAAEEGSFNVRKTEATR